VLGEVKLDARGRRLRAALAAGVVPDKTPGLRLMHDWLDSYVAVSPGGPRPHDPALTTPSGRPSHRVTKPHEDRPPISSHSAGRRRAHGVARRQETMAELPERGSRRAREPHDGFMRHRPRAPHTVVLGDYFCLPTIRSLTLS
jgi:hypothetical protein